MDDKNVKEVYVLNYVLNILFNLNELHLRARHPREVRAYERYAIALVIDNDPLDSRASLALRRYVSLTSIFIHRDRSPSKRIDECAPSSTRQKRNGETKGNDSASGARVIDRPVELP